MLAASSSHFPEGFLFKRMLLENIRIALEQPRPGTWELECSRLFSAVKPGSSKAARPVSFDSTPKYPVSSTISFMPYCFQELRKNLFVGVALGCLLCSVALGQTVTVRKSYTPGVDFSKYHSYKWVEIKGQHSDPSLDAQIKQSIDSQLAAKGLTKADDSGDLSVDYQTAISKVEQWETYEDWSTTGPEARLPQRKQVTIDVGTLVLDMYDTAAKQLVWTGRAHKVIDPNSSPTDRQKNLDNAAKKLLTDFPPK